MKSRGQKMLDAISNFVCMILAVIMIFIGGTLAIIGGMFLYNDMTGFDPYEEYDPEDIPERADSHVEIIVTAVGTVILAGGIAVPVSIISKARKEKRAAQEEKFLQQGEIDL